MIVDVSTFLPIKPRKVEMHLRPSHLLIHVAFPLIKLIPYCATKLHEVWKEGAYWVSFRLLGFIPFAEQAVVISYPESPSSFSFRDNAHSVLVEKWDHGITIDSSGTATTYRDHRSWNIHLCYLVIFSNFLLSSPATQAATSGNSGNWI